MAQSLNLQTRWGTDQQGAIARLKTEINPRRVIDANITEIQVSDQDAQLAADIANGVADVYMTQANQPRNEQAHTMLARLQRECDTQAERLRQAESDTEEIRQQLGLTIGQGQFSDVSLNPLRQQVAQAEAEAIESQIRLDMTARAQNDLVLALQSSGTADRVSQTLASQLIEAESKLADADGRYGPDHPRVRQCQLDLDRIVVDARKQVDRIVERAQLQRDASESRAAHARQRLGEAQHTLTANAGNYAQLLGATQREDVQRSLHKLLMDRSQRLSVDLQVGGPAAELIEAASAPSSPDLGTARQVLLLSLGLGLAAGAAMAVFVDRMDRTIRAPDEVAWQLNLPLLGALGYEKSLLNPSSASESVEAFRMIRNGIDFADHTLRSLCVTGATSGEGTSMTAANLAWTWAEHGARVLVIDANLHHPSIHTMFGISGDAGLIDFLTTHRTVTEMIVPTSIPNVSVLPAGKSAQSMSSPTPITPQQLSELLISVRNRADIIVIDTGPVLETSDTGIIVRECDATVLVMKQGRTAVPALRMAIHVLRTSGDGLLGAVLTGVPAGASWDPMPLATTPAQEEQAFNTRADSARQRRLRKDAA